MRAPPRFPLTLVALFVLARGFAAAPGVSVAVQQEHRGWHDAIVLGNGTVEAVLVPSVGRVMQFRFTGENESPFWENEKLAGHAMLSDPWKAAHGSFGGDKTWPAPQALWNWPPPDVFDAAPLAVHVNDDRSVTLTSPESPRFGLRTVRRITLDATEPVMRIETSYEKISGEPLTVSVWIITQLRAPVAAFMPIPARSRFADGVAPTWPAPRDFVKPETGWVRITRDPVANHKTGNDAPVLVWADQRQLLRIDQPRVAGADYPDDGCSVEIYTNADPVPYVEFETLGPLKTLRVGDKMSATNTYRLARRTAGVPLEQEVRDLLAR